MNSTFSDRVKGFLNRRSVLHSELRPLDSREIPASISSQSLTTLNSMATKGPKLVSPPGKATFARAPDSPYRRLARAPRNRKSDRQEQQAPHSRSDHASRPSLIKNHTIANAPTPSIHHAPVSHCAARLTTTTNDNHPHVMASTASARSAWLPIFSAMSSFRWAKYLCVPKTLSELMTRWNRLSWRNDRAVLFRPGRPGLAIQVEGLASG
jgi:hypothetical protein